MTIAEFKSAHNLETIDFRKKTQAGRLISYQLAKEVGKNEDGTSQLEDLIMTAEGFVPSKEVFVYRDEERSCLWVSNKKQKEAILSI